MIVTPKSNPGAASTPPPDQCRWNQQASSILSDEHTEYLVSFMKDLAEKNCDKNLTGIAIGVMIDGQELSAVSGLADIESKRPVSEATVFELGSLSKLFTSLLLAVAVTRQEVRLDDPVQPALGEQVKLPTDGESQITYRSLANHRSSLPRLPDDLIATADMENPYVHYNQEMLYACLNRMESVNPIGLRMCYSNFGVGLLGHALGKLAGSNYHTTLKERVLIPLGMLNTFISVGDEQIAQLATAHKKKNVPARHWDFTEVTVAAGGVRSSLTDMLKFLRANIVPKSTQLADALALMREPSRLPEPEKRRNGYLFWLIPMAYLTFMAGFSTWTFGKPWLTRLGSDGLFHFLIMSLPTLGAAMRWGRIPGVVTLMLMTFLTWVLWGVAIAWIWEIIWGAILIYTFANWVTSQSKFVDLIRGEGRLAWQCSKIGSHSMLWHNGMVGGSASFLGLIEELEVGVVVLTNTAKHVDAIGIRVLSELVKLKQAEIGHPTRSNGER